MWCIIAEYLFSLSGFRKLHQLKLHPDQLRWGTLMGSCPIAGSVPTMDSPIRFVWVLAHCPLTLWLTAPVFCFYLCLSFFFFLKVWTSSPLPKQYSSPYISVSSYILPQIWVCSKSLLLFVKCKLRVALALTSCLNLKAYLSFLSVNLCCTFHKKMVFLCELYIISYELFLFYNLILLSFPLSM